MKFSGCCKIELFSEFNFKNFGFYHQDVKDFYCSQWQNNERSVCFFIYRWLLAIFFIATFVVCSVLQFSDGKFFIFLTNWGIFLCAMTQLIAAILITRWHLNVDGTRMKAYRPPVAGLPYLKANNVGGLSITFDGKGPKEYDAEPTTTPDENTTADVNIQNDNVGHDGAGIAQNDNGSPLTSVSTITPLTSYDGSANTSTTTPTSGTSSASGIVTTTNTDTLAPTTTDTAADTPTDQTGDPTTDPTANVAAVAAATDPAVMKPSNEAMVINNHLPVLIKVYWILHYTSLSLALVITIVYWAFLHGKMNKPMRYPIISFVTHCLNSVFMVLDFILVAFPVRLYHVIYPMMLATFYCLFTVVYFYCGGTDEFGNNFVYPILDWGNNPIRGIITYAGVFVLFVVNALILYLLYKTKRCVYQTYFSISRMLNANIFGHI